MAAEDTDIGDRQIVSRDRIKNITKSGFMRLVFFDISTVVVMVVGVRFCCPKVAIRRDNILGSEGQGNRRTRREVAQLQNILDI